MSRKHLGGLIKVTVLCFSDTQSVAIASLVVAFCFITVLDLNIIYVVSVLLCVLKKLSCKDQRGLEGPVELSHQVEVAT